MDLATALRMAEAGTSQARASLPNKETRAETAHGPFPGLTDEQRERLSAAGIDPEASLEGLLREVRVKPPPRLLRDLGISPGFL